MKKVEIPITHAVRFLRDNKIPFEPHFYTYEERGGTKVAARELNVADHLVIKTILFMTDEKKPLIMLMHGDMEVSAKNLARNIGVKSVIPADARNAEKLTGYQFGGMSPFGPRTKINIYVEESILKEEIIYINGGKRGFLVAIQPHWLETLNPIMISVGIDEHPKCIV
ncbi:MAG: Cys-tRNA(Pro) deacylase [Ignavibacteriales bacterium]|nr:Cys-tRNA(Pro) deacylase [Ignavibacteriales bacterium]